MSQRRVLFFIPAIVASENQTAVRIAELLALAASRARPGTWSVQATPRDLSAVVTGPSGEAELEVVQLDYLSSLMRNVPGAGAKPESKRVFSSLWFAARGTRRLAASWGQHQKSTMARAQLFLAFAAVGLLWACFVILLLAAFGAVASVWLPDWTLRDTTGGKLVLTTGVGGVLAWLYWRSRSAVLLNGERLRALMAYFENQDERLYISGVFDEAFDAILEKDPDSEVHIFAFSFGSIVALDALFPDVAEVERRRLDRVRSLVTMGCPADLVHLLYPKHFGDDRVLRRADLVWTNVFIPLDILGSNFVKSKSDGRVETETETETEPPAQSETDTNILRRLLRRRRRRASRLTVAGRVPSEQVAVGASSMPFWLVPTFRGFVVHGKYWDDRQPRHLEHLLSLWLPATDTTSAREPTTQARDVARRAE